MSDSFPVASHHALAAEFAATGMNENAARILAAAVILFADKGYSATSVREIVRAADVTNPMLYYYFESKQGVFQSLVDFLFESLAGELEKVLADEAPIDEALRQIAQLHFDACREQPQILRFIYSTIFGPRRSRPEFDVICAYDAIQTLVHERIEAAIADGCLQPADGFDALYLTERFLGLISNHLMTVFSLIDQLDDSDPLDAAVAQYLGAQAVDDMMSFFLRGACDPVPEAL